MSIVQKYIEGLKNAYIKHARIEEWNEFEKVIHGVSNEELEKLKEIFPDIPESLVDILKFVDGTYHRKYGDKIISFYFLGSDLREYPYYLLSIQQMLDNKDDAATYYGDFISREYEEFLDIVEDEKIGSDVANMLWLHFSDCMNNGGSSQLFIDFSPSKKGTKGQIVRYVHDPDKIEVIANSFDEYLQMLMDKDYDFIHEK